MARAVHVSWRASLVVGNSIRISVQIPNSRRRATRRESQWGVSFARRPSERAQLPSSLSRRFATRVITGHRAPPCSAFRSSRAGWRVRCLGSASMRWRGIPILMPTWTFRRAGPEALGWTSSVVSGEIRISTPRNLPSTICASSRTRAVVGTAGCVGGQLSIARPAKFPRDCRLVVMRVFPRRSRNALGPRPSGTRRKFIEGY